MRRHITVTKLTGKYLPEPALDNRFHVVEQNLLQLIEMAVLARRTLLQLEDFDSLRARGFRLS
jgi:hypothetical protein